MAITRDDATIYEGTTFQKSFIIKDLAGVLVDLTGYDARIEIRPYPNSPDLIIGSYVGNSRIIITAGAGKILWDIAAVNTIGLDFRRAYYDLLLIGPDAVYRPGWGVVSYSQRVTLPS